MTDSLKSSLYVETWTNGQGHPMPSLCVNRTLTYVHGITFVAYVNSMKSLALCTVTSELFRDTFLRQGLRVVVA